MKYTIFALACAVVPALAGPSPVELVPRAACSAASVNAGIAAIQSAVAKLDSDFTAIKTTDGSDINLQTFLSDSNNLVSTINAQTSAVKGCSPGLDDCGAAAAQIAVYTLISSISALARDIVSKKVPISSRSLQTVVRNQASSQLSAANAYGAALGAKIPTCLATIASVDVSTISVAINSIFAVFV